MLSFSCTTESTIQYGYIGNGELMQECARVFLGTARMKYDKGTDEEGKKRGVSIRKEVKLARKKKSRRPITT